MRAEPIIFLFKYMCSEPGAPLLGLPIYILYKSTVVYCESLNLIGYITVFYLLIENSYA